MNRNGVSVGLWILVFVLMIGSTLQLLSGETSQGAVLAAGALGLALLVCRQNPQKSLRP